MSGGPSTSRPGRHFAPIDEVERRAAVVSGTDASGWGAGALVWIDGQREEMQLEFTDVERARPINWRELLGILRIPQAWGARLRGTRLLVETDNMTAYATGRKRRARVAAMQELVRRLVDVCEEHDIELVVLARYMRKLLLNESREHGDSKQVRQQQLLKQQSKLIDLTKDK